MNEYDAADNLDLIIFTTVRAGDINQLSSTVQVEGISFENFIKKIKGQDKSWAKHLGDTNVK